MSREEHLAWCKERALEYVEIGELQNALASMGSDLDKHEATKGHAAMRLGFQMLIAGHLNTPEKMRKFILEFN
jgi:hypothetical protein